MDAAIRVEGLTKQFGALQVLRGIDCTNYYRCMWDALLAITPEMIMDTARKYLITDQFYTAVAGQME